MSNGFFNRPDVIQFFRCLELEHAERERKAREWFRRLAEGSAAVGTDNGDGTITIPIRKREAGE